jgi:hypothetical protein
VPETRVISDVNRIVTRSPSPRQGYMGNWPMPRLMTGKQKS